MPGIITVSAAASCADAATGATSAREATVAHLRTLADRPTSNAAFVIPSEAHAVELLGANLLHHLAVANSRADSF